MDHEHDYWLTPSGALVCTCGQPHNRSEKGIAVPVTNNEEAETLVDQLRNIECYYGGELRGWMRNAVKEAADALAARRLPVSGDNQKLIDEAREYADALVGGENENWMILVNLVCDMADALEASRPREVEVTECPCAFQMEQCRCGLPRGHSGLHECVRHRFSDRSLAALGGGDHAACGRCGCTPRRDGCYWVGCSDTGCECHEPDGASPLTFETVTPSTPNQTGANHAE